MTRVRSLASCHTSQEALAQEIYRTSRSTRQKKVRRYSDVYRRILHFLRFSPYFFTQSGAHSQKKHPNGIGKSDNPPGFLKREVSAQKVVQREFGFLQKKNFLFSIFCGEKELFLLDLLFRIFLYTANTIFIIYLLSFFLWQNAHLSS